MTGDQVGERNTLTSESNHHKLKKAGKRYHIFPPPKPRPPHAKDIRIDLERLLYSAYRTGQSAEFTKTLKVALSPVHDQLSLIEFAQSLKSDYEILYGPLLVHSFSNTNSYQQYSFLEFLLDLWCFGFIFVDKEADCREVYEALKAGEVDLEDKTFYLRLKLRNGDIKNEKIVLTADNFREIRASLKEDTRTKEGKGTSDQRTSRALKENHKYPTYWLRKEIKSDISPEYIELLQPIFLSKKFADFSEVFKKYFEENSVGAEEFWKQLLGNSVFVKLSENDKHFLSRNLDLVKQILKYITFQKTQKTPNWYDEVVKSREFYHFITRFVPFLDISADQENVIFLLNFVFGERKRNSSDAEAESLEDSQTFLVFNGNPARVIKILDSFEKPISLWTDKIALLREKSFLALQSAGIFRGFIAKNYPELLKKFKEIKKIFGLSRNYTAYSYLLNLDEKRFFEKRFLWKLVYAPQEAVKVIKRSLVPLPTGYPAERVVKYLSERLTSILSKKPNPASGNSWHDYRHLIGGKLKSWVGNLLNYISFEDDSLSEGTKKKSSKKSGIKELGEILRTLREGVSDLKTRVHEISQANISSEQLEELLELNRQFEEECSPCISSLEIITKELNYLEASVRSLNAESSERFEEPLALDREFERLTRLYARVRSTLNLLEQKLCTLEESQLLVESPKSADVKKHSKKVADSTKKNSKECQKTSFINSLPDRIPQFASFVGFVKFSKLLNVANSFKKLEDGLKLVFSWLEGLPPERLLFDIINNTEDNNLENFAKNIQRFYRWYEDAKGFRSSEIRLFNEIVLSAFKQASRKRKIFWKSKYSRQAIKELDSETLNGYRGQLSLSALSPVNLRELIGIMQELVNQIKVNLSAGSIASPKVHGKNCAELSHYLKLCRIIASLVVKNISLTDLPNALDTQTVQFIQSGVKLIYGEHELPENSTMTHHVLRDFFSELEGAITILRATIRPEKLPIQILNGNQSQVIKVYETADEYSSLKNRFLIFNKVRGFKSRQRNKSPLLRGIALDERSKKPKLRQWKCYYGDLPWCFEVRGSTRHLKWLFLYYDLVEFHRNRKRDQNGDSSNPYPYKKLVKEFRKTFNIDVKECPFEVKLRGPTLIFEYWNRLYLNPQTNLIEIKPEHSLGTRWYCSMPFKITCNPLSSNGLMIGRDSYLGIDIGEYCLAYALLRPSSSKPENLHDTSEVKIIKAGLLASGGHKVLADRAAVLKSRQKSRTFGLGDYLARLRKHLINDYRNQIHARALTSNAILIYEYQVAGFESVDNRIKKIYYSLRKSDALDGLEATKKEMKDTWGQMLSKEHRICNVVSAYLTSQICLACRRHFMEYLDLIDVNDEQKVTVEIVEQIGDVCRMRLTSSDRMVWSFGLPQSQRQLGKEITLTVREIKKYVRNYLRPPAKLYLRDYWKNSRSDWLRKLAHSRPFLLPKNAILRRGNSAIFRCPIHDCGAIADADIQAAINIALRGIFEDKNSSVATKSKGEKSNFSKFLKFIKSIQLLPDENSGFRDLNDVLINKSYFTGHVEW